MRHLIAELDFLWKSEAGLAVDPSRTGFWTHSILLSVVAAKQQWAKRPKHLQEGAWCLWRRIYDPVLAETRG